MNTEPIAFLKNDVPARFAQGMEALRADPGAKAALDDVMAARGVFRFMLEGSTELWVKVDNGVLETVESKPEGVPVRAVVAFPADASPQALALVVNDSRVQDPNAPKRFAQFFSARAEKVIEGKKLDFHVIIKDVPERDGDVVIRVSIGGEEPPATPQFTATINWDDIEDMREGDMTPPQVIARLKLTGDASVAMAMGMQLLQQASQARR